MTKPTPTPPPVFDCRARRHKVLAGDGICVLCGRRDVVDARRLPAPAASTAVVPGLDLDDHPEGL